MSKEAAQQFKGSLILFDGVCNLCNGFVQFVLKNEQKPNFYFAPLQSEFGQNILTQYNLSNNLETVIVIKNDKVLTQSDAALEIARDLKFPWPVVYFFKIIPGSIRNSIYKWVAKNRYNWFGKKESCMIPTPELKKRFFS